MLFKKTIPYPELNWQHIAHVGLVVGVYNSFELRLRQKRAFFDELGKINKNLFLPQWERVLSVAMRDRAVY